MNAKKGSETRSRWKEKGEWNFASGWHKYNPHHAKCDCGSSNIKFLWNDGEVVGFSCKDCGETDLGKG